MMNPLTDYIAQHKAMVRRLFFFFMSNDPTVLWRQGLPGSLSIPLIRKCEFYTHLPLTHVTLGKFLNLTPSYYLTKEMRRLRISHSKTFQKAKIPFTISPVPFLTELYLINNYLCFFLKIGITFLLSFRLQKITSIATQLTLAFDRNPVFPIPCCITADIHSVLNNSRAIYCSFLRFQGLGITAITDFKFLYA